jgi:hypothetical protein
VLVAGCLLLVSRFLHIHILFLFLILILILIIILILILILNISLSLKISFQHLSASEASAKEASTQHPVSSTQRPATSTQLHNDLYRHSREQVSCFLSQIRNIFNMMDYIS